MEKVGYITEKEVETLKTICRKYWNRNYNHLHVDWLDGVEYVLKHLNKVKHY